jgi:predicted AlkP superfamily pyrophosphatase or phosphodiesterase
MNILKSFSAACTLALAALLSACGNAPAAAHPPAAPKLVVLLVVDGLPQRQVVDYRDQLAPDGLARFLDRGAWFANAHYGHAFTVTAAGHATMLTGAYPHRTGIIGNEWFDPLTGQPVYCTGDTLASYIGHKTHALDGTSPKNLQVQTVGDVLRGLNPASKVIGISGKDRGAILPAGKTGTAYIYMSDNGQFASTTYYMKEHPAWVNAFNDRKPADRFFKASWTPLLEAGAYARSVADEQAWFAAGGKLPMVMGASDDKPTPAFYGALLRSPFADALTLEFARTAIAGEGLGQADRTDILSVSLSGHDYVNHAFGAESRLSHDHLLQLDRLFQSFFHDLDASVGKDNYIAVLTADHGFMPAPEYSKSKGMDAGRLNGNLVLSTVNQGLTQRFGPGRWATHLSASALLLDRSLMAQKQVDVDAMREEARRLLLTIPGMAAAYTWRELDSAGSRADAPLLRQMQNSFNKTQSGDVQFALKPYWMLSNGNTGTTHGSPYAYDTNVPILFYGPAWIKPGRVDTRVEEIDIAPTLAALLRIPKPPSAEGKPLPLP